MAQWKDIKGFEGLYQISDEGQVKALACKIKTIEGVIRTKKERLLKPNINSAGYLKLDLCKNGAIYTKSVHRLVAEAFIPNPENKPLVDHIDGNRANPKVENLRWVTQSENMLNPVYLEKMSGKNHPFYGRKVPDWQKKIISEGAKKWHKEHPYYFATKVKNITTGKIYNFLKDVCQELNVNHGAVIYAIKNKTPCKGFYFEYLTKPKKRSKKDEL